jgi:predicted transcriptional regulator
VRASKQSNQSAGTTTFPALVQSSTDPRDGAARDSAAVRQSSTDPSAEVSRDPVAVRAFIERFTTQLCQAGFPRTPARIFVAMLTSDASRMNAAELGDLLQISAASVSGGVRYLLQVGLVTAEGEPGSRRLHYRMSTAIWQDVVRLRDRQFTTWAAELRQGADVLGPASPAGARLAETVRYFEFISSEMAGLLARWQADAGTGAGTKTGS